MSPTIVVGLDLEESSKGAFDAAVRQAKASGATLVLVHAFKAGMLIPGHKGVSGDDPISEVRQEVDLDEAVTLSTQWAAEARKDGVTVETVADEGDPASLVLAQAQQRNADLIVVGRHAWGPVKRFILGSVALEVAKKAPMPVLVVPPAQ